MSDVNDSAKLFADKTDAWDDAPPTPASVPEGAVDLEGLEAEFGSILKDYPGSLRLAHWARENVAAITALARSAEAAKREGAVLREALKFYAMDHPRPNDGPWGYNSTDFGNVARAALKAAAS